MEATLVLLKRHSPPRIYIFGPTTATRLQTQPRLILERLGYMGSSVRGSPRIRYEPTCERRLEGIEAAWDERRYGHPCMDRPFHAASEL